MMQRFGKEALGFLKRESERAAHDPDAFGGATQLGQ